METYAAATQARLLASYREVESGTRSDRPMLTKAIAHANRSGATLIIAKLDRLARNVHFLSGLMESGVDFIACDNPHANRRTIHILAAVAEDEAQRISERTKTAMAAYKARGGTLGTLVNLDGGRSVEGSAPGHGAGQGIGTYGLRRPDPADARESLARCEFTRYCQDPQRSGSHAAGWRTLDGDSSQARAGSLLIIESER